MFYEDNGDRAMNIDILLSKYTNIYENGTSSY